MDNSKHRKTGRLHLGKRDWFAWTPTQACGHRPAVVLISPRPACSCAGWLRRRLRFQTIEAFGRSGRLYREIFEQGPWVEAMAEGFPKGAVLYAGGEAAYRRCLDLAAQYVTIGC